MEELDAQKHSYNQSKQGARLFAKARFSGFAILLALGGGLAGFILLNGEIYDDPLSGSKSFCFFNKKVKISKNLIFQKRILLSEAFISKLKLDYGHKMKKENQHNLDFVIESLTENIERKMQNKIKIKEIVILNIDTPIFMYLENHSILISQVSHTITIGGSSRASS